MMDALPGYPLEPDQPEYQLVHQLGATKFSGYVIPPEWFQFLTYENGKPHMNAIFVLADLIYWYQPKRIEDEETGRVIGYRKRFKGDKVHRSYTQYEDRFSMTKMQSRSAVDWLVEQGYITKELRTITLADGKVLNNVMFLEPVVKRVLAITHPNLSDPVQLELDIPAEAPSVVDSTPSVIQNTPCVVQNTGVCCTEHTLCCTEHTNTETTTETATTEKGGGLSIPVPRSLDPAAVWSYALEELEMTVTRPAFDKWIRPTKLKSCQDPPPRVVLEVDDDYAFQWLSTRMLRPLKEALAHAMDVKADRLAVVFIVRERPKPIPVPPARPVIVAMRGRQR